MLSHFRQRSSLLIAAFSIRADSTLHSMTDGVFLKEIRLTASVQKQTTALGSKLLFRMIGAFRDHLAKITPAARMGRICLAELVGIGSDSHCPRRCGISMWRSNLMEFMRIATFGSMAATWVKDLMAIPLLATT